jgi:hypothetical protein
MAIGLKIIGPYVFVSVLFILVSYVINEFDNKFDCD